MENVNENNSGELTGGQIPIKPPENPGFKKIKFLIILTFFSTILIGLAVAGSQLFTQKFSTKPVSTPSIPTVSPGFDTAPTTAPLEQWATYSNKQGGYTLKYPPYNSYVKDLGNEIVIEFAIEPDSPMVERLFIRHSYQTRPSLLKRCVPLAEESTESQHPQCLLDGSMWNQEKDIAEISIRNLKGSSFYVSEGIEADYHIIQIASPKIIELSKLISTGISDEIFTQILSTFEFMDYPNQPKTVCSANNGIWIEDFGLKECENLPENICLQTGGKFDPCASPCRHDPEARACIEVCVEVCKFD